MYNGFFPLPQLNRENQANCIVTKAVAELQHTYNPQLDEQKTEALTFTIMFSRGRTFASLLFYGYL